MFREFFQYLLSMFSKDKKFYGVSTDETLVLDNLPRKYPEPEQRFALIGNGRVYKVLSVDERNEKVLIYSLHANQIFDVDIEFFEELFVPEDLSVNYPL